MVGAQLLHPDGTLQRNARRFYSLTSILLRRTPLGRLRPKHPELRRHLMLDDDLSRSGPVDWITGAWMLVRREALDSVGPMDRRFFLYFEDVDWCYRMWEGGWEVHLLPEVRLVHQYQRTSKKLSKSLVHHARSFLTFYDKWGALVYVARRMRRGWSRAAAVLGDLVALNLAFLLAFFGRRALDPIFPQPLFDLVDYLPLIASVNVVSLAVLPLTGRYREREVTTVSARGLESILATFLVTLIVMAGTYLTYTRTFSRAVLLLFVPLYLSALHLTRGLRDRMLAGGSGGGHGVRRALVVGGGTELCADLAARGRDTAGAVVGAYGSAVPCGLREVGQGWPLSDTLDRYRITEILLDGRAALGPGLREQVQRARVQGGEILVEQSWAGEWPDDVGGVRRWGHAWSRLGAPAALEAGAVLKPVLDRGIGLLLLLLSLPGFVLCSLFGRPFGVRWSRREALGLDRRPLRWVELVRGDGRPMPGWAQAPLFARLITGAFGLVGPLPLRAFTDEEFSPDALLRFAMKPGLAGPWQDLGPEDGIEPIVRAEVAYLERWSAALDLDLFLRALPRLWWRGVPWEEFLPRDTHPSE
jgi:hypothetical protein